MNFPPRECPECREPGFNITSLSDDHFLYICHNHKCSGWGKTFCGDEIPEEHKADGRARVSAAVAPFNAPQMNELPDIDHLHDFGE